MPYHITYRPEEFEEMRGNSKTMELLEPMLDDKKDIPHAFLFSGPSGTGKTTIARIIAKKLKCGVRDLKELNTADFRGIDTIRDVIFQAKLVPIDGKVKVWILDEAHKLTNDAQNALLKTLECPPEGVYFILCTTEPLKLLGTIRNRCTQFSMQLLNDDELTELMKAVAEVEDKNVSEEILEMICAESLGCPRTALIILEKVLAVPENAAKSIIKQTSAEQNQAIELCRALVSKSSWSEITKIISSLNNQDIEETRRAVLGYCSSILLRRDRSEIYLIMDSFRDDFYSTGKTGLLMACYEVFSQNKK